MRNGMAAGKPPVILISLSVDTDNYLPAFGDHMSLSTNIAQDYLEPLLNGDRAAAREVIQKAINDGASAYDLLNGLIWPMMENIQSLYREDRITQSMLNLATLLNRSITDQLAGQLPRKPRNDRKVIIVCGNDEPEELGGQIAAELFESDGWTTRFAGGGIPEDEVLKLIGEFRPDLLVMFATLPSGVPGVRKLIDYLREVNSCPQMQVMCCGGIYKRAEGLAEEIGRGSVCPGRGRGGDRQPTSNAQGDGGSADRRPDPADSQGRGPQGSDRTTRGDTHGLRRRISSFLK